MDLEQVQILDQVRGYGTKDAEKVKNLMLAYLSEKGYLEQFNKKEGDNSASG